MKTNTLQLLFLAFGLASQRAAALAQSTSDYNLNWSAIAGGSGTSTSAVYAVSATVGQPDASCMTGGAYTCEGGFWSVVAALQPPGIPLSVAQSHGVVTVAWPLPSTNWVLEQAPTLTGATIPWSEVPAIQYHTNTTHISITVPTPGGSRFYRLHKP
jgi:hypothetical protein